MSKSMSVKELKSKIEEGRLFLKGMSKIPDIPAGGKLIVHVYDENPNNSEAITVTNEAFANGRMKALNAINEKLGNAGVKVQNAYPRMTKEQIIKGATEGRWDLQQDVDDKRTGEHVWIKRNGKDSYIEIK